MMCACSELIYYSRLLQQSHSWSLRYFWAADGVTDAVNGRYLVIPIAVQKDRGLWERDCSYSRLLITRRTLHNSNLEQTRTKIDFRRIFSIAELSRAKRAWGSTMGKKMK